MENIYKKIIFVDFEDILSLWILNLNFIEEEKLICGLEGDKNNEKEE